jgi:hypothetical protein
VRSFATMCRQKPTNNSRRRGAPCGNRNAWKHGERSAQAELQRQLSVATVKALALLGHQLRMFAGNRRVAALRSDQRILIWRHDPELAELLWLVPDVCGIITNAALPSAPYPN